MTAVSDSREIRGGASEIKFIIDPATADRLRDRVRALLNPDPHAGGPSSDQYRTTSIYFDTDDHAVYQRRGSYRRAKYRIRRYGNADVAFLERKLRTSESLSKRRTVVRLLDLPLLTATDADPSWEGRWFHQRLVMRRLRPVCQVSYLRTARVGVSDWGPIRFTLDDELLGVPAKGHEFIEMDGALPLTQKTILELKFRGPIPPVFKQIVEEFALAPARISKYRLGLEAIRPELAASNA